MYITEAQGAGDNKQKIGKNLAPGGGILRAVQDCDDSNPTFVPLIKERLGIAIRRSRQPGSTV